jgi:hypothetical protein
MLQPDASAVLREQLMTELGAVASADEAAVWAKENLPAKNTLTPADADVIERALRRSPSAPINGISSIRHRAERSQFEYGAAA